MTKIIHFYTDVSNPVQISDEDMTNLLIDVVSTRRAIKELEEKGGVIHTTQLSFLADAWQYIDEGITVIIHVLDTAYEVKEHMPSTSEKDIRKWHNIEKLLIRGVFGDIV